MNEPRVVPEPLGGSPLSRAVQAGDLDRRVFVPAPHSTREWAERVRTVGADTNAGWFDRLSDAFGSADRTLDRLQRTARAGGVVVTSGQQAGLFGGPIYTWSKAIAMLTFADTLERETGTPVAPVFWAATDDADFAEASRTYVTENGGVVPLEVSAPPPAGTPMALAPLGDVTPLLATLRRACGSLAYERAYAAVADAYAGETTTLGSAYVRLLRALLEPLGIAVLDSSHPSVRGAGGAVMRAALDGADAVAEALDERRGWLVARGFEPQVADVPGLSAVFILEGGRKRRVPLGEARATAATADASLLSPNVLLRPVVERGIVPTVAYVGGPGELAYFAQVSAVAQALGVAQPIAVPRWSCTIVEPPIARALARLAVEIDAVRDPTALQARVARAAVPAEVRQAMAELRAAVRGGVASVARRDHEASNSPLLAPAVVEGAARQLEYRVDRLERRLVAAAKRRGNEALRDVQRAQTALWPGGHRQERTLNFIPLLARYGDALWTAMRTSAAAHAERMVTGVADVG
ncbi:MAG: bacillithiol biosynthesis cysteine-adding enzyme BshC [Gemmatimonadaceae bacterium]